jgi:uncharacterized protein
MAACPICKKEALGRAENVAFPFCSPRCKMIDLGKWLSAEYRVPVEGDEVEEDGTNHDGDGDGDVRH